MKAYIQSKVLHKTLEIISIDYCQVCEIIIVDRDTETVNCWKMFRQSVQTGLLKESILTLKPLTLFIK